MKQIVETLFPMNRCLLGEGNDNALEYLKHLIDLEIQEFPSGTEIGTWIIPDEWIVRDAWVKFNGEKIVDYQKDPMSLMIGSIPFKGKIGVEEFKQHLIFNHEAWTGDLPEATPYAMDFYGNSWKICMPRSKVLKKNVDQTPTQGVEVDGKPFIPEYIGLEEGEYEVFIDTERKPGKMKIGVHTKKGKSDREILLLAHLDHPFQANDNLSGVACLVDLVSRIKCDHTIKLIICPETVGSTAYALTNDLSKVDFVISVDVCGNDNTFLINKAYDKEAKINRVAHLAVQSLGESYRKGEFRSTVGSDESVFNDPMIGIPGILISRHPYNEYHTSEDTPDKINYDKIKQTGELIERIIEIYEKDFIPVRNFKGQLMRSRYDIQSNSKQKNLMLDYLVYGIDGKRYVSELCCDYGLAFDDIYNSLIKLKTDGKITCLSDTGKGSIKQVTKKEHTGLSRSSNVRGKRKKVS